VQIFDVTVNQARMLKGVAGTFLRWSRDGRRFAAVSNAREPDDPQVGVWVYSLDGTRQQVFRGWAPFHAWSGPNELLILEAKPDLNGNLWRVRLNGSQPLNLGSVHLQLLASQSACAV
jgi:hypothetical protein